MDGEDLPRLDELQGPQRVVGTHGEVVAYREYRKFYDQLDVFPMSLRQESSGMRIARSPLGAAHFYDHHRPRSAPTSTMAKRRSIWIARTSGASAPVPRAMIATESIPPGVVAR